MPTAPPFIPALHLQSIRPVTPLNTLDQALHFAGTFSMELQREGTTSRAYRVFASLTHDQFQALVAFLYWRARAEVLEELKRGK